MSEPISVRSAGENQAGLVLAEGEPALAATDRVPRRRSEIAGCLICTSLSVTAAALFLSHQSLWMDEVDQMGGLSLNPFEVVSWLAGWTKHDFVMPIDCMPPVSYWLGWLWSKVFGLGEVQLRWLGVTYVGMSTLLVFQAARKAWGLPSGVAAGLLFGLSPTVITWAVEIRAYPLFLLSSAATYLCLTRLLADPVADRTGWLVGMAACGLIASYTHFFGLVAIGGCLLATLILVSTRNVRIGPIFITIAVVGLLSLGLTPFVIASAKAFSGGGDSATAPSIVTKIDGLAKSFCRLFSGTPTLVSPIAFASASLGAALAGASCLAPKRRSATASTGLLLALISGAVVVIIVGFMRSSFNTFVPRYNVWMIPVFTLLLSSGFAAKSRGFRRLTLAGVVLLSAANLYGTGQLAIHGDDFAHGPDRQIRSIIRSLGTDKVAVIHDGNNRPAWWEVYAPLRYTFGGVVPHYAYNDGGSKGIRVVDYPELRAELDPISLPQEYLIVIHATEITSVELAGHLRRGTWPIAEGPVARALVTSTRWVPLEDKMIMAFIPAKITLFRRARPSLGHHAATANP